MKKKVNRQNNTQEIPYANNVSFKDDYLCYFSFKRKPVSEAFINRLILKVVEHADNPNTLTMKDFYIENKMDEVDASRLRQKYPDLDRALKYMKMAIANRREKGALKNEFNATFVSFSQPLYDEEWKALVEWRESLKSQDINVKIPDIIEIPAFKKDNE